MSQFGHAKYVGNGVYVPAENDRASKAPQVDLLDWANVALCDRQLRPTLGELRQFDSPEESLTLYTMGVEAGAKDQKAVVDFAKRLNTCPSESPPLDIPT